MDSEGVQACNKSVDRLLQRVARRVFANGNMLPTAVQSSVSLPATPSSLPEYFLLERFSDREEFHARMQSFVRAGAICADWDRNSSEQGQLVRLTLTDPEKAALLLGIDLPWTVAAKAIRSLELVAKESQLVIDHIVEGWKYGKAPGGVAPVDAGQFLDSIAVIEAARRLGASNKDLLLRRVSAQLFGDSKRIEALVRPIAYLIGEVDRPDENIFSYLGLVKHPQPMLVSGSDTCRVHVRHGSVPLLRPYIGLRPDNIDGLSVDRGQIKHLLTIENLASFNEAAEYCDNPDDLILVYVAGSPTPSWLAAYKRLLQSVNPSKVMHWGDIDVGGFRIAARIAESAAEVGYLLTLWKMNAALLDHAIDKRAPGKQQLTQIAHICEKYGWTEELEGLRKNVAFMEQEFIEWVPPNV